MYTISTTFQNEIDNDNRNYAIQLIFTLTDSTTITVTNSAIWSGGLRFEDAVSGDSDFQVGSAIINKMSVTLNNIDDDFSNYDFEGATVVAYIGINITSQDSAPALVNYQDALLVDDSASFISFGDPQDVIAASEYIRRGTYIVDSAVGRNTSLLKLECLDYMSKLDEEYGNVSTAYPATLQTIVNDICSYCDITIVSSQFNNYSYTVASKPDTNALTCRQVLAYAAQIAGCWARMDEYGRLELAWYGSIDSPQHSFTSIYEITSSQYTVGITGVQVTEEFPETQALKKDVYLYGLEGYVLAIEDNDLIQSGKAQSVAEAIGARTVGMTFKVVDARIPSDPSVEAGDTATITDEKGNVINMYITSVVFEPDNSMQIACSAKSPVKNASSQFSELARTMIKATEVTDARLSEYDVAVQSLTTLITESFGFFKTEETQADGSVIVTLHNKPTLAASNIQWRMTSGALAVSTDYGETWNAGIDASGNAVVNVLSAVGVNADWIAAGALRIPADAQQDALFYADYDTSTVYISGDRVFIGDTSVADALSELSGALLVTLSNESQGIPVDSEGAYTTFPSVETDITAVYGGTDVTTSATWTYSAVNVTGTLTDNGTYLTYTPDSLTADTGYVTFTATYNTGTETLTNTKRFNLYKVYAGEPGPEGSGTPGRVYFLDSDVSIIKQGQDNAYVPETVTFSAFYRDGDDATRTEYTGMFKVEITTDGTTWTTVEYPNQNKTYTTYTPTITNLAAVRCTLYAEGSYDEVIYGLQMGNDTVLGNDTEDYMLQAARSVVMGSDLQALDVQSVAVVKDVSALTQEEVFNILTNDGETQGLYLLNGKLYLNAEYMATGVLRSRSTSTGSPYVYWNLDTGEFSISQYGIEVFHIDATESGLDIVAKNFSLSSGDTIESIAEDAASTAVTTYDDTLTQTEVYNRLTNNSSTQGLILSNGRLYINASYINSGTLSANYIRGGTLVLGGASNTYGSLSILHSNGSELITGDKDGLNVACQGNDSSAAAFSSGLYYTDGSTTYSLKTKIVGNQIFLLRANDATTAYFTSVVTAQGTVTQLTTLGASEGKLNLYGASGVQVNSNFTVLSGYTKSKVADTDDYGKRTLYCYEMATPVFGDIGEGVIADDGYSYIQIDPVFSETITTTQYQVFLQAYGDGKCYVKERHPTYFIVAGTAGLSFGWEIKARQADVSERRLEKDNGSAQTSTADYASLAADYINSINEERLGDTV